MYMGEDPTVPADTTTPATTEPVQDPWYARPTETVLNFLGNLTYQTDDYTIRSVDGALVVDRRTAPTPAAPTTPATQQATIFQSLGRVPPIVWIGVGGLVLFSMMRR